MNAPPAWIKDGTPVIYYPGPLVGYSGVVNGTPRLLGETWCVALRDMDPGYRNGERNHVPAAACDCLRPVEAP